MRKPIPPFRTSYISTYVCIVHKCGKGRKERKERKEKKEKKNRPPSLFWWWEAEKDKVAECDQFTCGRERRSDFWAWHPFARTVAPLGRWASGDRLYKYDSYVMYMHSTEIRIHNAPPPRFDDAKIAKTRVHTYKLESFKGNPPPHQHHHDPLRSIDRRPNRRWELFRHDGNLFYFF